MEYVPRHTTHWTLLWEAEAMDATIQPEILVAWQMILATWVKAWRSLTITSSVLALMTRSCFVHYSGQSGIASDDAFIRTRSQPYSSVWIRPYNNSTKILITGIHWYVGYKMFLNFDSPFSGYCFSPHPGTSKRRFLRRRCHCALHREGRETLESTTLLAHMTPNSWNLHPKVML